MVASSFFLLDLDLDLDLAFLKRTWTRTWTCPLKVDLDLDLDLDLTVAGLVIQVCCESIQYFNSRTCILGRHPPPPPDVSQTDKHNDLSVRSIDSLKESMVRSDNPYIRATAISIVDRLPEPGYLTLKLACANKW